MMESAFYDLGWRQSMEWWCILKLRLWPCSKDQPANDRRSLTCLSSDNQEAIHHLGGRVDYSLEGGDVTKHLFADLYPFRIRCCGCKRERPYYDFSPYYRSKTLRRCKRWCRSCVRVRALKYRRPRPPQQKAAYLAYQREYGRRKRKGKGKDCYSDSTT